MQSSTLWAISSHKMCRAFFKEPIYGYLRVTEIVTRQLSGNAKILQKPRAQAAPLTLLSFP